MYHRRRQRLLTCKSYWQVLGLRFGADDDMWAVGCLLTELATKVTVSRRVGRAMAFALVPARVTMAIDATTRHDRELGQIAANLLRIEDAHNRPSAGAVLRMLQ